MVIVLTLFVLGIIIFVHELGHYLAAKAVGIYIETFSIGFGPKILSFRFWDTEWVLAAIPFGGYVKMKGDNPEESTSSHDEFLGKSVPQRIFVVLSGPLMNLILGFTIFFAAYNIVGFTSLPGNKVWQIEKESIAAQAGFEPGDEILSVDGKPFKYWDDFFKNIIKPGEHVVTVRRGNSLTELKVVYRDSLKLGIVPYIPPVVGAVRKGGPAYKAGLQPGDSVISINGIHVRSWNDMVKIIKSHPGKPIKISVVIPAPIAASVIATSGACIYKNIIDATKLTNPVAIDAANRSFDLMATKPTITAAIIKRSTIGLKGD
jgi:regulator of sigma E protease